jgi:alkylhydroperoxidase family enzyme
LSDLPRYETSARFSALEKRILDYARAMTRTPVEIDDALFRELEAALGAPALVELTAAIAWENWRARFNHAFGAESENFAEGAFCVVPERPALPEPRP